MARRKARAVVEPEDLTVALLIRPGKTNIQVVLDFLDQDRTLDGFGASGRVIAGGRNKIVFELFQLAGAALLGVGGFEMIANYVRCKYLDVAGKGIGVLLLEGTEDTKVVGTEFEVGFLNEVVYGWFEASPSLLAVEGSRWR